MTSVTIVGLLPAQAEKVASVFGGRLSLHFLEANTPSQQIRATAASSEEVILMTKFSSREAQDALRRHDITYVNGGLSSLMLKLEEML